MVTFFFESSALAKLYIAEIGTDWIKQICDPAKGNTIFVASVAGVEVVSAITRRQRAGAISLNDAKIALRDFRHDFADEFFIIEVDDNLISNAMALAEKHALRGYDAVQLAAALEVQSQRIEDELPPPELISADTALNDAALLEGLKVDDPNNH